MHFILASLHFSFFLVPCFCFYLKYLWKTMSRKMFRLLCTISRVKMSCTHISVQSPLDLFNYSTTTFIWPNFLLPAQWIDNYGTNLGGIVVLTDAWRILTFYDTSRAFCGWFACGNTMAAYLSCLHLAMKLMVIPLTKRTGGVKSKMIILKSSSVATRDPLLVWRIWSGRLLKDHLFRFGCTTCLGQVKIPCLHLMPRFVLCVCVCERARAYHLIWL